MACPPARDSKEVEGCKELVIDINLSDLFPENWPPEEWPGCCIYRIPKQLRKVKKKAYTPKLVSIGPFHHGKYDLNDMEKHKPKYLKHFLERTTRSQADLLKLIEVNEVKIRHCYSEDCMLESDDFVKMVLLDAVFIIELFNRKTHYILSKPWLRIGILHDLILLENQFPFLILEKLYMSATNDYSSSCNHHEEGKRIEQHKEDLKIQDAPFVKLSRLFFYNYDQDMKKKNSTGKVVNQKPIGKELKHFTDLVRYMFGSAPGLPFQEPLDTQYCATKLDNAGLKFKADDEKPLLQIEHRPN